MASDDGETMKHSSVITDGSVSINIRSASQLHRCEGEHKSVEIGTTAACDVGLGQSSLRWHFYPAHGISGF